MLQKETVRSIFRYAHNFLDSYSFGFILVIFLPIVFSLGCSDEKIKTIKIFKDDIKQSNQHSVTESPLRIAIAPVISPGSSLVTYSRLVEYLGRTMNRRIEPFYPKSYIETNTALKNGMCDIALICTGAYLKAFKSGYMEIIAVPVKSGKPTYNAYIIVNKDSNIEDFKQLKGKVFAFTDPLSLTGYYYIAYKLNELGNKPSDYFNRIVWTKSHDKSIKLVGERFVDGASVDSIVYDALSRDNNEYIKMTKVIEKSMDMGIPPIVVRSDLSTDLKNKIQDVFLNMELDKEGREILNSLEIDRFIKPDKTIYESAEQMMRVLGEID